MRRFFVIFAVICINFVSLFAVADTIILRDGTSYSGASDIQTVKFTDDAGVKYEFPVRDVQSLAFNSSKDTVALRNGKSYTGQFAGSSPINFQGNEGIKYQFPTSDIDAIVFNHAGYEARAASAGELVIPIGSDLPIRTNENIDSTKSYEGQTYSASITEDVLDTAGHVAIPAGSGAQLIVRTISTGGAVHSPDLILDLYSVTVNQKQYRVVSNDLKETNNKGLGANRRTAELLGGGSALGALMGGIFGGGRGAGVGALAGAGGGFLTQAFTRGKEVRVPAESVLRFRLERTLLLNPA